MSEPLDGKTFRRLLGAGLTLLILLVLWFFGDPTRYNLTDKVFATAIGAIAEDYLLADVITARGWPWQYRRILQVLGILGFVVAALMLLFRIRF